MVNASLMYHLLHHGQQFNLTKFCTDVVQGLLAMSDQSLEVATGHPSHHQVDDVGDISWVPSPALPLLTNPHTQTL